ncbi:hypothetical protein BgiBS90_010749, partial [Biomphalaria glabrata]
MVRIRPLTCKHSGTITPYDCFRLPCFIYVCYRKLVGSVPRVTGRTRLIGCCRYARACKDELVELSFPGALQFRRRKRWRCSLGVKFWRESEGA